jgi:uncharacterized protein (DUF2236 family)
MLDESSVTWRVMADVRTALCGGRALLMQVAHPAVGAAVADHSTFREDPWPRLWGTVNSALRLVYGGPHAPTEAARLREMHRNIRGVDQNGRPYHALDPSAYFWVHATLLDSAIVAWRHFATPISADDQDRLYREWRSIGSMLGIPSRAMPADMADFRGYMEETTAGLTENQTVRDVLRSLTGDVPPPRPWFPSRLWTVVDKRLSGHLTTLTLGTLPPDLRCRLGLPWTPIDALTFARKADRIRGTVSALPNWARQYPAATYAYTTGRRQRRLHPIE